MLHGKNFKCHVGLYISQQCFLRIITAYNVFPSPPWQAPFLWGVLLQAALLNCCLSTRGSIQHLWPSMNIIFKSCKVLRRWKKTVAKELLQEPLSFPSLQAHSGPDWGRDLAEGKESRGCVRSSKAGRDVWPAALAAQSCWIHSVARHRPAPRHGFFCE